MFGIVLWEKTTIHILHRLFGLEAARSGTGFGLQGGACIGVLKAGRQLLKRHGLGQILEKNLDKNTGGGGRVLFREADRLKDPPR